MKNTTLADIVLSAQAAANEAAALKASGFEIQQHKLTKFMEAEFDRADYPNWEQCFNNQIGLLEAWSKQDSPATHAAKLAATAAAVAKPPTGTLVAAILLLLSLFLATPARAQFQPTYTLIAGTTNTTQMVHAYAPILSICTIQTPPFTLSITNVNTNQTYYYSFGSQEYGAAGTNLISGSSGTTNFSAGNGFTNGCTAYIPIPSLYWIGTNQVWGTFGTGTNATTGSWTNGVGASGL